MGKAKADRTAPITAPFTILVDNNEQLPYWFRGFQADAKQHYRPIIVPRKVIYLNSGDYTIEGMESIVAVERKSKADLYQTLSRGRDAFEALLDRMNHLTTSCVVVEEEWTTVLGIPPSGMCPKAVFRTIMSYQVRFPRVHWNLMPSRWAAETTVFRFLEKCWKHYAPAADQAGT